MQAVPEVMMSTQANGKINTNMAINVQGGPNIYKQATHPIKIVNIVEINKHNEIINLNKSQLQKKTACLQKNVGPLLWCKLANSELMGGSHASRKQ